MYGDSTVYWFCTYTPLEILDAAGLTPVRHFGDPGALESDGAIHFNHWGCRQSCGGAQLVKRALQAKGVPTLILDGDCVDEREYQEGQISTRLEAFLESLH